MDWQRIKDRVTEEVVRQLTAAGKAASPEQVQQMVVSALQQKVAAGGASSAPAPAPAAVAQVAAPAAVAQAPASAPVAQVAPVAVKAALPQCDVSVDFKTDVLVVVAGPVCNTLVAAVKELAATHKVTVVTTGQSERLASLQACQVVTAGNEETARRLAKGAKVIIATAVPTTVAAKVSQLIGDCLPSAVIVYAALFGKRVIIARDQITAPPDATFAIRRKVEDVVQALKGLGFTVTTVTGVVQEVNKKLKDGEGGLQPAFHPAVLASREAKAQIAVASGTQTEAPAAASYDRELARMIDHTLLKPESTAAQVEKLCKEAAQYHFMSVCINPGWVSYAAQLLKGTDVKVCTVIGFPLGATSAKAKALETEDAIKNGATEVDMVLNVGALKSGQYDVVLEDVKAVVNAAKGKALTKVILETGLLTDAEKVKACEICKQAGADFVKTSTGFGPGGATVEDIALMRETVGPLMGVKASGGIRDFATARAMVAAGANRIGASASIAIVMGQAASGKDKY